MTKLLIRSFLSLSIILSLGYARVHAHAACEGFRSSTQVSTDNSENVSNDNRVSGGALAFLASPEKHLIKIHVREVRENEEDEHDVRTLKKGHSNARYFTAIFCGQIQARFFDQISPFAHRRHLIIRVFRI